MTGTGRDRTGHVPLCTGTGRDTPLKGVPAVPIRSAKRSAWQIARGTPFHRREMRQFSGVFCPKGCRPEKQRRRFGPVFYQASQFSDARQIAGLSRLWPLK